METTHEFHGETDFCLHCKLPLEWLVGGLPVIGLAVSPICPRNLHVNIRKLSFPIDHFGIVSGPLLHALVFMSGDKRKRRGAYSSLIQMAKGCKAIPRDMKPTHVGLVVNRLGNIELFFEEEQAPEKEDAHA